MQKDNRNQPPIRDSRRMLYLSVLIIVAAVTGYTFFSGRGISPQERFSFGDPSAFTLTDSSGTTVSVPYAEITFLEFVESPDFGEPVTGTLQNHILEGEWRNDAWGSYTASADDRIACCILARTGTAAYAFNYESADATRDIFRALKEVLPAEAED